MEDQGRAAVPGPCEEGLAREPAPLSRCRDGTWATVSAAWTAGLQAQGLGVPPPPPPLLAAQRGRPILWDVFASTLEQMDFFHIYIIE